MTFNIMLVPSNSLSYTYGHKSQTHIGCLSHGSTKLSLTVMRKGYFERGEEDTSARVMNEEEVNKCCRCAGLPPSLPL